LTPHLNSDNPDKIIGKFGAQLRANLAKQWKTAAPGLSDAGSCVGYCPSRKRISCRSRPYGSRPFCCAYALNRTEFRKLLIGQFRAVLVIGNGMLRRFLKPRLYGCPFFTG
jgi:hypothetical protein